MNRRRPSWGAMLAMAAWALVSQGAPPPVSDQEVAKQIADFQQRLLEMQRPNGAWSYDRYPVGITALAVQALVRSGVAKDHPAIVKAAAFLDANSDKMVYSEGLVPGALAAIDPVKYRERIENAVNYLRLSQTENGAWSYDLATGAMAWDNSNTQFAAMGLGTALEAGVKVPVGTRDAAIGHWRRTQGRNGAWGYTGSGAAMGTLPMTCAGIASLSLLGVDYAVKRQCCGAYEYNPELGKGLAWLADQLKQSPERALGQFNPLYALYALERVGISLGVKEIGGIDWYRWGADAIVNRRIRFNHNPPDLSFALLFLAKGFAPIALAKWEWRGDWNNQVHDARRWTEYAGLDLGTGIDWISAPLDRLDSPAAKASLLFVSGRREIRLTDQELAFLRAFLDADGTLVAEATCGSDAFFRSFREEILGRLCPEYQPSFMPLEADHPLLAAHYQLTPEEVGAFQFSAGCKQYRIILLTRPISCALNGDLDMRGDLPRARQVAVNLLAWAMAAKAADRKLDAFNLEPSTAGQALTFDQIQREAAKAARRYHQPFGRLRHRGQWMAAPGYFQALQQAFTPQPRLPQYDGQVLLSATDGDLFEVATLFMTGYDAPRLNEAEIVSLRAYLQNGGFLFVTAACSTQLFDQGFRKLIAEVLPNDALEAIPPDDPLWLAPYPLPKLAPEGTTAYHAAWQQRWAPLYGIRREGRWIVVYSPIDLCSDALDPLHPRVPGYRQASALRLAANILHYAMTP